jgi:serine protease Do
MRGDVEPRSEDIMGMSVADLTPELREEFGIGEDASGIAVTEVDEDSDAYAKGLRAGDLIEEAGQLSVSTVDELEERIEEARDAGQKSFLLLIRRDGDPRFVALSLDEEE